MDMAAMTAAEKRAARAAAMREQDKWATASADPSAIEELNKESTIHPDKVRAASGEIARPSSSGAKVTVACKLGVAYLNIQLCKIVEKFEQNMQGGRTIKEANRVGEVVRLRGTAYPRGTPPDGFPERPTIVAGAALNRGIDKDFWDAWVEQNKLNPLVMNGMIFAYEDEASVAAKARELVKELSGLDPINPKNDSRITKSTRSDVSNIETEDSRAKAAAG
jgi:hypothetical protein